MKYNINTVNENLKASILVDFFYSDFMSFAHIFKNPEYKLLLEKFPGILVR